MGKTPDLLIVGGDKTDMTIYWPEVRINSWAEDAMDILCCPDCGEQTLRLIETTEPDGTGEYKEVRTCDGCENIVYIIRRENTPWTRFMYSKRPLRTAR
jgi:uncharacterized protein YbaR (Trm112 family)